MNNHETVLEQAMRAFVAAHRSGALPSIEAFVREYPTALYEAILDFIEEFLMAEVEAALTPEDIDPAVLAAVGAARRRILDEPA